MKYLIDKQMYDAIVWMLPDATPIKEMVSKLKPIEPLSLETIRAFKSKYPAEDLCQWSYNMGAADAERYFIGLYGITC